MIDHKPSTWLVFENQSQWEEWLKTNHLQETSVWIQIKKANANIKGIRLYEAVETALCYGWIDGRMYSIDDQMFIISITKRRKNSVWSLINKRRIIALSNDNLVTKQGYLAIEEAKANGSWDEAYTSKETLHHSDIFIQQLKQHKDAYQQYQTLKNIDQLHIQMWMEQCRTEFTLQKRINHIIKILESQPIEVIKQTIASII